MRRRFTFFYIISVIVCCLLAAGCSRKNDISGTWKGKITLPATEKSLSDLEFSLMQKNNEVTGFVIFTKPGAKLPLSGTVKDGAVSLSSPLKNGLAVSITGTLMNRSTVNGEAVLNYDTPQLGKRQDKTVLVMTR
jgi:hypothetical protein